MEFRQRGQRDDRRRRVLSEEQSSPAGSDARRWTRRPTTALYASGAAFDLQPRVTELLPRRPLWLAVVAMLALLVVAALHGAHFALIDSRAENGPGDSPWRGGAFDLTSPVAIARWVRSTALLAAAALAVVVYAVRRHRTDDYRAGYRAWLWIAGVWVLLSISATAAIPADLSRAMASATGWTGPAGGAVWWIGPVALLTAAVGIRLLLEMRDCWLSAVSLGAAGGCALTVVIAEILAPSFLPGVVHADLMTGATMLAALAMLLHGRHVVLEAQGLIGKRRKKRERAEAAAAEKATPSEQRAESAKPAGPAPPAMPSASRPAARPAADDEDDDDDSSSPNDGIDPRLSKAERKRLRKLQKEERRSIRRAA